MKRITKTTFTPKLFTTLRGYTKPQLLKDLMAGVIVGIVALPLAIAFAIASGVSPEKGSFHGYNWRLHHICARWQPRADRRPAVGAFIVIVYGIVQVYGIDGLIIATFLGGILLLIMGFARLGAVIRFIPHPLIVGFTTGIALIIFSSQVKDFLGLKMGAVPADFVQKWQAYAVHITSVNTWAVLLALATVIVSLLWQRITYKVPGSLIAIIGTTCVAYFFHLPVETIGSKFGPIASVLPHPAMPHITWQIVQSLIRPAFTIALLGGIESLLSAVVADGMIGGRHRSNMELVAQGTANIFSAMFGGIPATGAIARTATNIKNGGRTPVAGMTHAVTLLVIVLFIGKWAALIPMATLAGILVIVAYNMSEWRNFISIAKGSKGDAAVLVVTFLLTVLIDLTVAIEIGMVLAVFLFMAKMTRFSNVKQLTSALEDQEEGNDNMPIGNFKLPKGIIVYEINGPLFFGAAYKFKDAISIVDENPQVLIVRMRNVPIIDATGMRTLEEVEKECHAQHTKLILAEVTEERVLEEIRKSRLLFKIGKANVVPSLEDALARGRQIIAGD